MLLEGLFTYRTFEFSKSKGVSASKSFPNQGTKKPSAVCCLPASQLSGAQLTFRFGAVKQFSLRSATCFKSEGELTALPNACKRILCEIFAPRTEYCAKVFSASLPVLDPWQASPGKAAQMPLCRIQIL